jgi:hypothetical protein
MNWDEFPGLAQVAIWTVALLTAGLAAVSVALSYDAAYHLVLAHGHYSPAASKIYPLILDGGLLIAELTAITMASLQPYMRRNVKRWPFTAIAIMTLAGVASIWMNLLHVGNDKIGWLIAALPPVFMILSFQMLVVIVRRASEAMGHELFEVPAVREAGRTLRGKIRRTSGAGRASAKIPKSDTPALERNKADIIRTYLRELPAGQLQRATKSSVTADLDARGVRVDETWTSRILSEVRSERNGNG